MDLNKAIAFLDHRISCPSTGLPEELFLFVSRVTPLVNVDLLIKNEHERILLSLRNDPFAGVGWHIPGGIVRYQERLEIRLMKVAENEIGVPIKIGPEPIAINQIIDYKLKTRGHFISLLYKGFVTSNNILQNNGLSDKDTGYLKWHNTCPTNLIKYHEIYRKYM